VNRNLVLIIISLAAYFSLSPAIAQSPPPQFIPTDVTPYTISPQRNEFAPGFKFKLFKALPERLWITSSVEVSQRLDTNVLFTYSNPKAGYAFRTLPNITLGYDIARNTAIYTNYFVIKDVYAPDYNNINAPTTQSLSWGIRHTKALGQKTSLQFDFQARELWQAVGLHQFDFLPGATATRVLTRNNFVFASTLLQLRGGQYFVAPTREIDPFYTLGYVHRLGKYTLLINDTLVTNFRHPPFNDSIPPQSNVSMIADLEINRPVSKKLPFLLAFVRAEPIWNWDSAKAPGISGFDFRLYTGLRLTMTKPSYYSAMKDLRKKVMSSGEPPANESASPPSSSNASPSEATPSLNTPTNPIPTNSQ
jgi:hypothetical protein